VGQGNYEIRPGQYGATDVKAGTPTVFSDTIVSDISKIDIQIPCFREGAQIGLLKVNSSMIQETKYLQQPVDIEGAEGCTFLCWAGLCTPSKHDFGPLRPLNLPKHFLIGHRGSGNNLVSVDYLENSMPGFMAAHKAGVDVVEFDIQFTNDKTPAIFHNFFYAFKTEQPQYGKPSNTDNDEFNYTISQFSTEQFIASGLETQWKTPRPLFRELLTQLPPELVFDIEMKYPFAPVFRGRVDFLERNEAVDLTLDELFASCGDRRVFFSSFDPMVCIYLAQKQKRFPVYQLTTRERTEDINQLETKVKRLAEIHKFTGVAGFVLESKKVFKVMPGIFKYLIDMGYVVSTYGSPNNTESSQRSN